MRRRPLTILALSWMPVQQMNTDDQQQLYVLPENIKAKVRGAGQQLRSYSMLSLRA